MEIKIRSWIRVNEGPFSYNRFFIFEGKLSQFKSRSKLLELNMCIPIFFPPPSHSLEIVEIIDQAIKYAHLHFPCWVGVCVCLPVCL